MSHTESSNPLRTGSEEQEKVQQRVQTGWGTILLIILKFLTYWHFSVLLWGRKHKGWDTINGAVEKFSDCWEGVIRLTKQMLVSGTMSESETTSSFPEKLAELSKGPSASKLQGITVDRTKNMEKKTSHCEILATLPVWRTLVKFCDRWFVHFYPYRPVEKSEVNFWREKDGKLNRWLWQQSFTSVEEKWRRLLCCLRTSWTGWPDCHLDYLPEEGSSAPDLACLAARLRRTIELATNDAVPDLNNIGVTWFTYRHLPRSLCF